ncbi:MAG: hypothetical protein L6R40_001185 [Gallowayella cf. fulva]|nr:MAG: hypothetical protein L6R40_001185 [Xanthomendoza cf. fulva]
MMLQTHRVLARLVQCSPRYLDKHALTNLAFNASRVASLPIRCLGSHGSVSTCISNAETLLSYRSYATDAVSRPKAHTGRTTSAPRKKASTAKLTASKAAAAPQDPAAEKTKAKGRPKAKSKSTSKPKSKSKPRTRAKSTKARKKPAKKPAKAKAKPAKKKKAVSPEKKNRIEIKELKAKALTPPKRTAVSAFSVLLAEKQKELRQAVSKEGISVATQCSTIFRSFSPEQREHYNHLANQNKAAYESTYQEWIRSHTPTQIHEANKARKLLRSRTSSRSWQKLHDERQVSRLRGGYISFSIQRFRSGDFSGMRVSESSKLIGAEWRGMSESDKKFLPAPYLSSFSSPDGAWFAQLSLIIAFERASRVRKSSSELYFVRVAGYSTSSLELNSESAMMFTSSQFFFTLLYSSRLIFQALTLPANSICVKADQPLSLQVGVPDLNLTKPIGLMLPWEHMPNETRPVPELGQRPKDNYIWPDSTSGRYFIRIRHYKDYIPSSGGQRCMYALSLCSRWHSSFTHLR